ncbi:DUF397 domain-containing protein [Actinophytocola xanthii]|uniref:DUF397 domain-containing protein n=1 Tax=Actinophytocola xanthii TaxID=1912961 RepID=A0A1Q8C5F8_9PSEU|nr:DUF397 domain-containing protein [Actinophytocola xanthii]OLF09592.1 hypothetical protein BU204_33030 [Actinophytocola xanthii]
MITWRKSSRSESAGQCVEVRGDLAALRDSKDPAGHPLCLALGRLLTEVKAGRFDR